MKHLLKKNVTRKLIKFVVQIYQIFKQTIKHVSCVYQFFQDFAISIFYNNKRTSDSPLNILLDKVKMRPTII